jgi:hypothetical protein
MDFGNLEGNMSIIAIRFYIFLFLANIFLLSFLFLVSFFGGSFVYSPCTRWCSLLHFFNEFLLLIIKSNFQYLYPQYT